MPEMSGHDATRRDDLHTISVRQLEAAIAAAGIVMSHRQLLRHCKVGTFDAVKLPAANNVEEWFIAPASLEKGIADIKVLQEHRARRVASSHDMTDNDAPAIAKQTNADASGHDATRQDPSDTQMRDEKDAIRHDTSRQVTTTHVDVYEHPYVTCSGFPASSSTRSKTFVRMSISALNKPARGSTTSTRVSHT